MSKYCGVPEASVASTPEKGAILFYDIKRHLKVEGEASAVGLGALPLKPPWRELRRVAMDCGAATNRSGGVERRETKAGARLLDIDEECLPLQIGRAHV